MAKQGKKKRNMDGMKKREPVDPADIIGCYDDNESVHLDHEGIEHHTDKAALIVLDGEKKWIPKSQIMDATEDSITITSWFAEKDGLE